MDSLRNELVEAQKARTDLIKWKLLLVAALGAIGLRLNGSPTKIEAEIILCGIPFVCAYVDLMCRHLSLRIKGIGVFLKKQPEFTLLKDYEELMQKARGNIKRWGDCVDEHSLESIVIRYSSYLFSYLLIIYAVIMAWIVPLIPNSDAEIHFLSAVLIIICGLGGIFTTWWLNKDYRFRRRIIDASASSITLFIPDNIPEQAKSQFVENLNEIFHIEKIHLIDCKSAEQHSFIKLVANTFEWMIPLNEAATCFVNGHGSQAVFHNSTLRPLKKLARAIYEVHNSSGGNPDIFIGLPIPDLYYGAVLRIEEINEQKIARYIANFVIKALSIEKSIQNKINKIIKDKQDFDVIQLYLRENSSFEMKMKGVELTIY